VVDARPGARPGPPGPPGPPPGERRRGPGPEHPEHPEWSGERPTLRETLSIYRRLVGARIRADWQYRTAFLLFLLSQFLVSLSDFAAIAVIFSAVDELAGWTGPEVAFLYGMSGLAFGLGDLFVSPVEWASRHIKAGTFDQFLIRPVGALWQLLATEFAPRRLGRTVQPLLVLVISLTLVDADLGPVDVLLVAVTVVSSTVIFSAIWVITSSLAFWTVETQELANSFTYGGNFLTDYPVDVLAGWLRRLVIFVVPLASICYLPAVQLFDKPMPDGLPRAAAWTGPFVAAALALAARGVWGLALRHYRSTGS
jgi:ABC-2 type transport system permease protein